MVTAGIETKATSLKQITSGQDCPINELTNVGGFLFFSGDNSGTGAQLWRSDGTSEGTVLIKDIVPGKQGSHPRDLVALNGVLFFSDFEKMEVLSPIW